MLFQLCLSSAWILNRMTVEFFSCKKKKKKHTKIIKTRIKTELKTYFTESFLFETCNPVTQTLQEI